MLLKWSYRLALNYLKPEATKQCIRWNHYKSLGLSPSASSAEVKAAYYRLSKIHHPDRNNGSEASAKKFRDIVAAYEVLGKTDSRKKYDREIVKKYEARIYDSGHRSKKGKRNKKSCLSKTKSKHSSEKFRYKMSGLSRGVNQKEQEDLEAFIFRAIPLVVACFMYCKKR